MGRDGFTEEQFGIALRQGGHRRPARRAARGPARRRAPWDEVPHPRRSEQSAWLDELRIGTEREVE